MLLKRTLLIAVALGATFLWTAEAAQARAVRRADAELTSLAKAASTATKLEPGCCTPEPVCCPKPCITYRHCGPKLCCGNCDPPTSLVLTVKDPCTGCETEVPVCLPACCKGEPTVCCGSGFLGRDVVEYQWCCGFSVRVAFKRCGDLIVTTWGR